MKKIIFSEESQSNLLKIYDYISVNFSIELARNTINQIIEKIDNLKKFPYLGKTSEVSALVRELVVEENTVFYQLNDKTIEIIFIKIKKTKIE